MEEPVCEYRQREFLADFSISFNGSPICNTEVEFFWLREGSMVESMNISRSGFLLSLCLYPHPLMRKHTRPLHGTPESMPGTARCPEQWVASACGSHVPLMRMLQSDVTCILRTERNMTPVMVNLAGPQCPDICSNTSVNVTVKVFFKMRLSFK